MASQRFTVETPPINLHGQVNTDELDREKVYNYWESGPPGARVQNKRDAQLKVLTTMDVESLMVVLDDFEAKCVDDGGKN